MGIIFSKKLILIITLVLVLIVLIHFSIDFWKLKIPQIFAGTEHNVSGWAWSENIGWISFNSTNCDANGDGFSDGTSAGCPLAGTPMANYGVNINTSSGLFFGYAWSEHIGWINFEPTGPYPAAPNYSACLDLPGITTEPCNGVGDYQISGWARALAYGGGWDGWIKLRGTNYGVWIDTSTSPAEFRDWAWSDMVIGWISFNCSNQGVCITATAEGGPSNYKVIVNLAAGPNAPPTVSNAVIDGTAYCGISPGVGLIGFKWTYNDPDGDSQSQYHLQIATDSSFSDTALVVDSTNDQTVAPGQDGTSAVQVRESLTPDKSDLEVAYNNTYYWRIKARDSQGNWSTDWVSGPSFATPSHAYPWIDFSWAPPSPSVDEIVQFADQSVCYDIDGICNSWLWVIPDWQFEEGYNFSSQNPRGKFTTTGDKTVSLTTFDSDFSCTNSKPITSQLPLPKWKEIAPF